jgi:hypothetical protein
MMRVLCVTKNFLHISAVLIVLVVGGLGVIASFENPSSSYKNYSEMDDSGIINAGWVPDFIPRSAFEIEETHNIDSNIVKVKFRFNPEDTELAKSRCKTETKVENGILLVCKAGSLELLNNGVGYFTNARNDA